MKIDNDVDIVFDEFKEKKEILQNLADYKNTVHSIRPLINDFLRKMAKFRYQ